MRYRVRAFRTRMVDGAHVEEEYGSWVYTREKTAKREALSLERSGYRTTVEPEPRKEISA